MLKSEFALLDRGDQIIFNDKPQIIWVVDHPVKAHIKRAWMKIDDHYEQASAGGGDCDGACITISTLKANGRHNKRHTQVVSDYDVWTKVIPKVEELAAPETFLAHTTVPGEFRTQVEDGESVRSDHPRI